MLMSLIVIFYFRYYLVYVLITFYFTYFFYKNIILEKGKNLIHYIPIFLIFFISTFFISFRDYFNIIQDQLNLLGPLRYLASPLFINIMINEEFNIRTINSLISNVFSIIFFVSLFKYNYNDKLINF